jgi:hypothetical protein
MGSGCITREAASSEFPSARGFFGLICLSSLFLRMEEFVDGRFPTLIPGFLKPSFYERLFCSDV